MIEPFVNNEFSKIKRVVLGVADDFGGCPVISDAYDPKSKEHIIKGTFPKENDIKKELNQFLEILQKHNVDVLTKPESGPVYHAPLSESMHEQSTEAFYRFLPLEN